MAEPKSLAIAYAMKKKSKMAKGGSVAHTDSKEKGVHVSPSWQPNKSKSYAGTAVRAGRDGDDDHKQMQKEEAHEEHSKVLSDMRSMPAPKLKGLAHGGEVGDDGLDMVHRILKKCYSEGGEVSNGGDDELHDLADHDSANFDDLANRDSLEFHDTGENSGDEIGDHQEDEDEHDSSDLIKRILKKKDRNPKPA